MANSIFIALNYKNCIIKIQLHFLTILNQVKMNSKFLVKCLIFFANRSKIKNILNLWTIKTHYSIFIAVNTWLTY